MDYDMFLSALRTLARTEAVEPERRLVPVLPDEHIQLHHQKSDQFFCPITGLCYARTGTDYANYDWRKAADELGIRDTVAASIAMASDEEEGHDPKVRSQILEALGLRESA